MQDCPRQEQKCPCVQVQPALLNRQTSKKRGRLVQQKDAPGQGALGQGDSGHDGPGEVPRRVTKQEGAPGQGLVQRASVEISLVHLDKDLKRQQLRGHECHEALQDLNGFGQSKVTLEV